MIEKATDPIEERLPGASRGNRANHAARESLRDAWRRGKGVDCPAIDGILKEAEEVTGDIEDKRCWTPP